VEGLVLSAREITWGAVEVACAKKAALPRKYSWDHVHRSEGAWYLNSLPRSAVDAFGSLTEARKALLLVEGVKLDVMSTLNPGQPQATPSDGPLLSHDRTQGMASLSNKPGASYVLGQSSHRDEGEGTTFHSVNEEVRDCYL
jgi:hypothetical protein